MVHVRSPEVRIDHPLAHLTEIIDRRITDPPLPSASGSLSGAVGLLTLSPGVVEGVHRRPVATKILRQLDDCGPGVVEAAIAGTDDRLVPDAVGQAEPSSPVGK